VSRGTAAVPPAGPPDVALGDAVAAAVLRAVPRDAAPGARVATLGPHGTSAEQAAAHLAALVSDAGSPDAAVDLHDSFSQARRAVHDGAATCVLVPSAFSGATDFHWDPRLRLVGVVVHRTPAYGLAVRRTDALETDSGTSPLVVASLPEVAGLVDQLAPPTLLRIPRRHRAATSTADAARVVAEGRAHLAVCNDPSRTRHGLRWLASREGVPMPWSVFVAR